MLDDTSLECRDGGSERQVEDDGLDVVDEEWLLVPALSESAVARSGAGAGPASAGAVPAVVVAAGAIRDDDTLSELTCVDDPP